MTKEVDGSLSSVIGVLQEALDKYGDLTVSARLDTPFGNVDADMRLFVVGEKDENATHMIFALSPSQSIVKTGSVKH